MSDRPDEHHGARSPAAVEAVETVEAARLPVDPHEIWVTADPPEEGPRALKHVLADECRRAIDGIALLDATELAPAVIEGLIDSTRDLADRLAELPSLRARGGLANAGGDDSALLERSGITGRSNPLAAPLRMWFAGDRVRGEAVFPAAYEGPAGCLHGGFVAAAFDDLMGFAQLASGSAGYTGTLTVRMIRPTPLNERLDYEAGVDRMEGRKIFVWGTCHHGEELLARAEIVFIRPAVGMAR
ncbi:MAG: PaaI family thioesterase [Acidimicrobiales bacterium]